MLVPEAHALVADHQSCFSPKRSCILAKDIDDLLSRGRVGTTGHMKGWKLSGLKHIHGA